MYETLSMFLVMPAKSHSMLTGSWFIVDLNSRSVACWHPLWLHASVGPKLLPCCLSPPCATLTTTAPPCWGSISPSHIWAILLALHHIVHSYESQQLLSRLQSRAMLWNAWLVQKDESARIVICNALVVLCFKSAKDLRLDVQCTVAPPKCRAAQLPSCPIIYCPLPSPSTPPATSAPHLSAFTSSSWRFEDATPGVAW